MRPINNILLAKELIYCAEKAPYISGGVSTQRQFDRLMGGHLSDYPKPYQGKLESSSSMLVSADSCSGGYEYAYRTISKLILLNYSQRYFLLFF